MQQDHQAQIRQKEILYLEKSIEGQCNISQIWYNCFMVRYETFLQDK